ncbi:MAG: hypothetical protein CVU42_13705 [Chloroflexi bacterium HGW-Chloroflexi-4]|jgi:integrase|nr:MAG: hypothetical protein CVU42_13705 [Chloroflexi bacterium HGW-Chloroflexi-4]
MLSQTLKQEFSPAAYDLDLFSDYLEEKGNSEKTIETYCSQIRGFIHFFSDTTGQAFAPEMVIPKDLRSYQHESNQVEHCKAATWNLRFNALAAFFKFASEKKLVYVNPFEKAGLELRKKQKEAPRSLDRNDFARVERAIELRVNVSKTETQRRRAIRDRAMFSLLAYAGLRVGELVELRPSNLLMGERKGRVDIEHGKGNKEGSVPLAREARVAISEWLALNGDGELFDGITERQVQHFCEEISAISGVKFTPHTLRHTFVYRVLAATGGNLSMAKELARHNRLEQTQRYGLPHEEDKQRAVENL